MTVKINEGVHKEGAKECVSCVSVGYILKIDLVTPWCCKHLVSLIHVEETTGGSRSLSHGDGRRESDNGGSSINPPIRASSMGQHPLMPSNSPVYLIRMGGMGKEEIPMGLLGRNERRDPHWSSLTSSRSYP